MSRRFFIIDGHAQIFRAYFAPFRDLTSPDGEPTKATYVFAQMLINLVQQQRPDYLAMVIDSGDEKVFRKEIYPAYKANRKAKPDDFEPQEKRILQLVREAGVPLFAKGGFEADDLIATMAERLTGSGLEVVIVSKDKDLRQLMGPHIMMYDVQKDQFTDAASMVAMSGYRPEQSVEVQTLTGDVTDNVPGIPGVGEKTAAKLINKYGTAENVLAHADELTPKMKENFLKAGTEALKLARDLVTLKRDVEMEFDVERCRYEGLNAKAMGGILQSLGFNSLLAKLPAVAKEGTGLGGSTSGGGAAGSGASGGVVIGMQGGRSAASAQMRQVPSSPSNTAKPATRAGGKGPENLYAGGQMSLFGPASGVARGTAGSGLTGGGEGDGGVGAGGDPSGANKAGGGAGGAAGGELAAGREGPDAERGVQDTDLTAGVDGDGLSVGAIVQPMTSANCAYRCVKTEADLAELVAGLKQVKRFAFDTETDGLGAMRSAMVGMSFSWQAEQGWYVPVMGPMGETFLDREVVLNAVRPVLEDASIGKIGHNIKYDLLVMRKAGIRVRGVVLDTMVAAFLLDAGRMQYGIDRLALEKLNFQKIATAELIGKGKNQITMDQVPLGLITQYAAEDADITWRLAELLEGQLDQDAAIRKLNDELETPLIEVLVDMEEAGIGVDPAVLAEQSQVLAERIEKLRDEIHKLSGVAFNVDSPRQLGEVLFQTLGLKSVKKTKIGYSTDVEVLEKLAPLHPVPKLALEYRMLVKLKNTYLDNLGEYINPVTGKIHASFNQIGAATGRLSCNDPNLQNIPIRTDEGRRIRMAFVPGDRDKNVLLTADYSQIELRVLAHFTREPALVNAFASGEDIHKTVAAEVFGVPADQVTKEQRSRAKVVNFGIIYGISAFGLSRRMEGMSVGEAAELIAAYNKRFPAIAQFLSQCVMEAQETGAVRTILGRRRPVTDIRSGVLAQRNAAERIAINTVVQGSAADLIKVAMLNIHRKIIKDNQPCRMLIQVHDELVFQTPEESIEVAEAFIRKEMVAAGEEIGLTVPLAVESGWGRNWQELK